MLTVNSHAVGVRNGNVLQSAKNALRAAAVGLENVGYSMELSLVGPDVEVRVVARSIACAGCLVPKPRFLQMVTDEVAEGASI